MSFKSFQGRGEGGGGGGGRDMGVECIWSVGSFLIM